MIHAELLMLLAFINYDYNNHGYLFGLLGEELGGGLVGPTGIVCLDGMCNPNLLYFAQTEFEMQALDNYYSILSFAPLEYYPPGEYITIAKYEYSPYAYSLITGFNDQKQIVSYGVSCDPLTDMCIGTSSSSYSTSMLSRVIAPYCYQYLTPEYFWYGRFIAEKGFID